MAAISSLLACICSIVVASRDVVLLFRVDVVE